MADKVIKTTEYKYKVVQGSLRGSQGPRGLNTTAEQVSYEAIGNLIAENTQDAIDELELKKASIAQLQDYLFTPKVSDVIVKSTTKVDLRSYATCDGVTDGTTGFQAAATACGSSAVLIIPAPIAISSVISAACIIQGIDPSISKIINNGTGDALNLNTGNYYSGYRDFTVIGNPASRDGITLVNKDNNFGGSAPNNSYSMFDRVYSHYNGRHGIHHRMAWGTRYSNCKAHYNGGLGYYIHSELVDLGTANNVIGHNCDSRWNGGTDTATTFADDKGGVKIKGAAGVKWSGVVESNNAWGFIIGDGPSGVATRNVDIENCYMELNPNGATVGGNVYVTGGPWRNISVRKCWMQTLAETGKTAYHFYVNTATNGENGVFIDEENTLVSSGAGTIVNYFGKTNRPPKPLISLPFGDFGGGSPTTTALATVTADGLYLLSGFLHFRRNSDNTGGIYPFTVAYDPNTGRQVFLGTTIGGTSTATPILSFTGDVLNFVLPAYCYGYVELTDAIYSPPTTLTYNPVLFGSFMRRA